MKVNHRPIVLGITGAIACLVVAARVSRTPPKETVKRTASTSEERSNERVSSADEGVPARWVDDRAPQIAAVAAPPARAPSAPTPALVADRSAPSVEDTRAYLQTSYEREPIDAAWARDAQMELREAIQKQMPSSASLGQVECRTSLCRAQIAFDGPEQYHGFLKNAGGLWKGYSGLMRAGTGDDWSMVAFFAKPGQPLPVLE